MMWRLQWNNMHEHSGPVMEDGLLATRLHGTAVHGGHADQDSIID